MSLKRCFTLACAAVLLAGCAVDPIAPTEEEAEVDEQEFGSSVRHMLRAQTFNPLAGKAAQPPAGMDGQRAEATMEGYRGGKPVLTRESTEREQRVWTAQPAESGNK